MATRREFLNESAAGTLAAALAAAAPAVATGGGSPEAAPADAWDWLGQHLGA